MILMMHFHHMHFLLVDHAGEQFLQCRNCFSGVRQVTKKRPCAFRASREPRREILQRYVIMSGENFILSVSKILDLFLRYALSSALHIPALSQLFHLALDIDTLRIVCSPRRVPVVLRDKIYGIDTTRSY